MERSDMDIHSGRDIHSDVHGDISGRPVKRVAAIDCGTNSIRLLIADLYVDGTMREVSRDMVIVRLGQGVDKTGQFATDALERTFAACQLFAQTIAGSGVDQVKFIATSASRDVSNRDIFTAGIRDILGIEPEVISGQQEALLAFTGALSSLKPSAIKPSAIQSSASQPASGHLAQAFPQPDAPAPGTAGPAGPAGTAEQAQAPYLIVDLGGGSTELVLGTTSPQASYSMDIGSVRMSERYFFGPSHQAGPSSQAGQQGQAPASAPSLEQIQAATQDIDAALDAASEAVAWGQARTVIGLAGTVTTLTAFGLGLTAYDRSRVDGARFAPDTWQQTCADMLALDRRERSELGVVQPGRLDVIGAGALVWSRVLRRVCADIAQDIAHAAVTDPAGQGGRARQGGQMPQIITSEHDMLDGIALSML